MESGLTPNLPDSTEPMILTPLCTTSLTSLYASPDKWNFNNRCPSLWNRHGVDKISGQETSQFIYCISPSLSFASAECLTGTTPEGEGCWVHPSSASLDWATLSALFLQKSWNTSGFSLVKKLSLGNCTYYRRSCGPEGFHMVPKFFKDALVGMKAI